MERTDFAGGWRPQNPSPESEFQKKFPPKKLGRRMRIIYPWIWFDKKYTVRMNLVDYIFDEIGLSIWSISQFKDTDLTRTIKANYAMYCF